MGTSVNEIDTVQPTTGAIRAIRRSRLWSFVVPLLLLAQLALALHQLNHRIHPEITGLGNDCTLCHFASNMAAAPEPTTFVPPVLSASDRIVAAPQAAPRQNWSTSGFRSRAPPLPVSA